MTRSKKDAAGRDESDAISDEVHALTTAVDRLSDRADVLATVLDRLQDDVSWLIRNVFADPGIRREGDSTAGVVAGIPVVVQRTSERASVRDETARSKAALHAVAPRKKPTETLFERMETEPTVRLACSHCERNDGDGVEIAAALRAGWSDIDEIRTIEETDDNPPAASPSKTQGVWWTHLGVCPQCNQT